ncbi:MAG: hypothetical protein JO108_04495 [Acidobacteriaceae bacterium]|nr:hypothetical protein [Acidobacteriaceae bacterium]
MAENAGGAQLQLSAEDLPSTINLPQAQGSQYICSNGTPMKASLSITPVALTLCLSATKWLRNPGAIPAVLVGHHSLCSSLEESHSEGDGIVFPKQALVKV